MSQGGVIKQINKNFFVSYETTGHVWIWKSLYSHCPIIKTQELVDVKFVTLNFLLRSCSLSKISEFEHSIIEVSNSILVTF